MRSPPRWRPGPSRPRRERVGAGGRVVGGPGRVGDRNEEIEGHFGREAPGLAERLVGPPAPPLGDEEVRDDGARAAGAAGEPRIRGGDEQDPNEHDPVGRQDSGGAADGIRARVWRGGGKPGAQQQEGRQGKEEGHPDVAARSQPAEKAGCRGTGPVADMGEENETGREGPNRGKGGNAAHVTSGLASPHLTI